ncbi:MAG TPA: CDP-alcohol phosphatidyltransferase family protein [Polyangia bacterium]|nr:CDP-alcohol phosphatidyltransferase family protein [Polyangia bacterium]
MTRSELTLLPAVSCFVYFVGGVPFYLRHARRAGVAREPRIEARRRSVLIPKWLIYYLLWEIAPVEAALVRRRVSPNTLSSLGLALSLAAGAALSQGWFDVGGWLYLFVGIVDLFDGRVARATGRASRAGAFYDSVADRYSECAIFAGLMAYYRGSWIGVAVLAALLGSLMVSYARARAEAFGAAELAAHGAMQRPERIFLLGVALAASPFVDAYGEPSAHPTFVATVGAILLLAFGSHLTALSRTWAVFRALRERDRAGVEPLLRRRPPRSRTGASE